MGHTAKISGEGKGWPPNSDYEIIKKMQAIRSFTLPTKQSKSSDTIKCLLFGTDPGAKSGKMRGRSNGLEAGLGPGGLGIYRSRDCPDDGKTIEDVWGLLKSPLSADGASIFFGPKQTGMEVILTQTDTQMSTIGEAFEAFANYLYNLF